MHLSKPLVKRHADLEAWACKESRKSSHPSPDLSRPNLHNPDHNASSDNQHKKQLNAPLDAIFSTHVAETKRARCAGGFQFSRILRPGPEPLTQ